MPYVLRTAQAEQDLLEIWGAVVQRSPQKADRLTEAIEEKCRLLARFPEMGRNHEELALCARSTLVERYVVFYRVIGDGIELLRVAHGSRDLGHLFRDGRGRIAMRHPWRSLVAWFRVSDEEFVERVRRNIVAHDRWRRPLLIFYAGLTIVFVGILVATVRMFGSMERLLGDDVEIPVGVEALGFFLGLSFGAMLFILAAQIGQGLGSLLFGFRSERLMVRYHDALRERESKPTEGAAPGSPSP